MNQESSYPFAEIEQRVQAQWESSECFASFEDPDREKFYCLAMFPYPSGRLHMGHVRNYTIADTIARYQRQLGKNVLHPIGWDSFGLPAENAATEHGISPHQWTCDNIAYMRQQLKQMGMSYDWQRELSTCEVDYYRWEQWFFARLLEKDLVYRRQSLVNWDPVDQTVLANEQVIDGCGWRSGVAVEQRSIEQWFVRITDYAEELLRGLDQLKQWPSQVVQMQRNWIGRSEGSEICFALADSEQVLEAYTTRADTLYGVVAVVVSPTHSLVDECASNDSALQQAVIQMRSDSRTEAALARAPKRGHALGREVIHPLTGQRLPLYVGNYVVDEYGSGVVMLVPAHDQRDFEFARLYDLPIKAVVLPEDGSLDTHTQEWTAAFVDQGILAASAQFDGMPSEKAAYEITRLLSERGLGRLKTTYRLRDWGVSRQRYWGCPIPIEYDQEGNASVSADLPVTLPQMKPKQGGSLVRLGDHPDFSPSADPRKETDTLDTFFESSWYYARFCSPDCDSAMLDERVRYWLPVDQYVGGIEHAVLHLLYFRFFHKLMRDLGLVEGDEPAVRLLTQGMVVAPSWSVRDDNDRRVWVNADELKVSRDEQGAVIKAIHEPSNRPALYEGLHKMSKSMNNGVDPDVLLTQYGADATRLYILFTAPPEQALEWSSANISGCTRFLKRLYCYVIDKLPELLKTGELAATDAGSADAGSDESQADDRRHLHRLLKKALYDYERNQFNTVAAAAMEMMNLLYKCEAEQRCSDRYRLEVIEIVLRLLSPITPHVCEDLWQRLHGGQSIQTAGFPEVDLSALRQDSVDVLVQINNRKRGIIRIASDADRQSHQDAAVEYSQTAQLIPDNNEIIKVIVVEKKLVNIVCRPTAKS